MSVGEELCLACGLCCDGSLFAKVQLGPSDDAVKLRALGLPIRLSRARAPVAHCRQPCPALQADRSCRLYANRPAQCRAFECGLLQEVEAGSSSVSAALRWIGRARRKTDQIRRLLRDLQEGDESIPLEARFRRVKRRLESEGADAAEADRFAKLSLAMHQLDRLAHRRFYTLAEET